jgi:hypothetical protein
MVLQPEVKVLDTSVNQSFDYNGLLVPLSDMTTGAGPNVRNGNVVHPLSLDFDLRFTVGATSPVTIRFFIVRLLLSESGFTMSEFINDVGTGLAPQAMYNMETHGQSSEDRRVEIVFDKTFSVSTSYLPVQQVRKTKVLKEAAHGLVRYSGSNSAPIQGALLAGFVSTLAGPSGLPAASGRFRLHFLDC